jgi:hypothetical protein
MSATYLRATRTIGAELERDRLERRARRVTLVIAALRQQASERSRLVDAAPSHLLHVIADLETQVEAINARLLDLSTAGESGFLRDRTA